MLSLRICNYTTKHELFNYLLTIFPKNCLYAFSKQDLKLKRTDKTVNAIKKAKYKLKLADKCRVVSCYEAGRDGFWIHRWLKSIGVVVAFTVHR